MPVHTGKDSKGCYAQWGGHGKKYYFKCGDVSARTRAKAKAAKQGAAAHAHGYTGNEDKGMKLQRIIANMSGKVRHDKMEGRDFLVAPMVMLTEGVHAGSQGPLYYPSDELATYPESWNHKPVVVYHPTLNGQGVSACDPDILSSSKIGVIMNTSFKDGKLTAEAWLEESRIRAVDDRVWNALENEKPMELSTGLFTRNERSEGEWNGERYEYIARNYRPDHLALLPDKKGACSLDDGAGLLINEMSHDEIRSKIQSKLGDGLDSPWVSEVYETQFIFSKGQQLFRQSYKVDGDDVEVVGAAEEVVREVSYVTKNDEDDRKEITMKKAEIIEALISNESTAWTEEDKEALDKLSVATLEKMLPVVNEDPPAEDPPAEDPPAEDPPAEDSPVEEASDVDTSTGEAPTGNRRMSLDQYLKIAPPEVASMIREGISTLNAEKKRLVNIITANENCDFTEAMLNRKDVKELRALAKLAANTNDVEDCDYSGQGETVSNHTEEPIGIPVINFED